MNRLSQHSPHMKLWVENTLNLIQQHPLQSAQNWFASVTLHQELYVQVCKKKEIQMHYLSCKKTPGANSGQQLITFKPWSQEQSHNGQPQSAETPDWTVMPRKGRQGYYLYTAVESYYYFPLSQLQAASFWHRLLSKQQLCFKEHT